MRLLLGVFACATCIVFASVNTTVIAKGQDAPLASIRLSDLPIWTLSGNAVKHFPDNFVFFDPDTCDLIVSYPRSLEPGSGEPGSRNSFRVNLPVHVRPKVSVWITQAGQGGFEYIYNLSNGSTAQAPITRWIWKDLALKASRIELPAYWRARQQGGPDATGCEASCTMFDWMGATDPLENIESPSSLAPGESISGFRVRSPNRPGFVRTYFQGGTITKQDNHSLPSVVEEQLKQALSLEHTSWPTIVLAPKYPPTTSDPDLARSLEDDIKMLEERRLLDPGSPFVREMLNILHQKAREIGSSIPVNNHLRYSRVLRSSVKTGSEKQLLLAIEANFGSTPSLGH